ncbi:hypothetical protein [Heyndrickxia ginsengihumi]|uniref:hypothetical protein n=1 Tax=Heyndrickxia ginsengihumi TaxID=363870 RepID=UPI001969E8DA|nr:hypothetical protein [Heyndrickxia ginsengihumi]
MASNEWSMDIGNIDQLLKNMQKIPNRSEKVINDTLRIKGAPKAMDNIQSGIPVSPKRKKHAHDSKALNVKYGNLEFFIRPKKTFDYIKYPDLGIGTSKHNQPKQFMKKGLEKATPKILDDLSTAVINEINNTLGE